MFAASRKRLARWWILFLSLLLPLLWLVKDLLTNNLGADPAQYLVSQLGYWALICLWISLAVTPLRRLFGWGWLIQHRRMFGLYAFFYASLHLLAFATFLAGWRLDILLREVTERPYVIVGVLAFILLLSLAVTSTKKMQRRLGRRWQQLHYLIYPASILIIIHFIWQIRSDYAEQLFFSILLALMLGYRLYIKRRS
ncbi:sulfite oxidase heme-binding subunit YedZ [Amphritea balenae]|uniref:Protein-methionine-sulfoxide reductase heme-binding subunit MsrQ n=1 Tax=Amphritea balenae TaxID=452629 RepID=A0A3P1SJE7_9GAMM|nr:protein-methionine-sulfoxide reductase heme-binding subunit MsrQ [Amphritea balenae]RRC96989.1 sulfoxide reductase heme-binding subunit YedZ [Amphritea balenae]GGK85051.1 protein-methionine-sulfoxide reductase heme-binding subunit MsrQ [Amphritea balenae]